MTADPKPEGQPQGVQSVEIGYRMMAAMAGLGRPAPLREIADAAGLPVSAAHRYLVSLVRAGAIVQERKGGDYDLGPQTLQLGLAALQRLDHHGLALEALEALHRKVGHTAGLLVWGGHGATIVRWKEANRAVTVNARPGHVLPTTLSASGRVFAAFLPGRLVEPFVVEELSASADGDAKAVQSRSEFKAICDEIRKSFVAVVKGNVLPGIDAISAPVFDHDNSLRFVLAVWGSDVWIDVTPGGPVYRTLVETASALSASFGYTGDYPDPALPAASREQV